MIEQALTHREVVSRGGKARWAGMSKKARKLAMEKVRAGRKKKAA